MALREQFQKWAAGVTRFKRWRLLRRIGIAAGAVLVFVGLAGFLGVPLILRQIVLPKLAQTLKRPVQAEKIRFNPYVLRLRIEQLHIGERDNSQPFFDLRRINIKASWASLFRMAPVIAELAIDQPVLHIVRVAENRFNFSDLTQSTQPSSPATKPLRFSVSNIQLHDGDIHFEDEVTGQQHRLQRIRLDIPFIANLPADISVYVQPLLEMIVDGSPLRITGKARPFAVPPESVMELNLHRFELAPFLGYLPVKLPIKMPGGTLSSALELHFVNSPTHPLIRVNGVAALDQIDLRDAANEPLVGIRHAVAGFNDLEPLDRVAHLSKVHINGLALNVVRNHDGTINLTSLKSGNPQTTPAGSTTARRTVQPPNSPPPAAQTNQVQTTAEGPARQTTSSAGTPARTDFALDSFELINSKVDITDNSGVRPAKLALQEIHIGIRDLRTVNQTGPAPFEIATQVGGGGAISLKGAIDLSQSRAATDIAIDQVYLPALQDFAQSILAGQIAAGKLGAHAKVQAQFAANHFNVHLEPADASIDQFDLRSSQEQQDPVKWERLSLTLSEADLASRRATVKEVRSEGLFLFVKRERDGKLSLASLLIPPASPKPETPPGSSIGKGGQRAQKPRAASPKSVPAAPVSAGEHEPAAPKNSWQYTIESVAIEHADIRGEDDAAPQRVMLAVAPLNVHLQNISNNFTKQVGIETDGAINGKGNFKVSGNTTPMPLSANLHVMTHRVDLAVGDPYASNRLNTTIGRALLSTNGTFAVATEGRNLRLSYRGDAALASVRMFDRLTKASFLRWRTFSADRIDFRLGVGQPRIHVGTLALSDFYARVILNRDGHLNLRDITANPQSTPTSVTQPQIAASQNSSRPMQTTSPAPSVSETTGGSSTAASASSAQHPIPADVELGKITLQGGQINYTDNFIRPNYSANLSDIGGKIGAFGTKAPAPAEVALKGQINGTSPINIDGSISPLAPMAFLDIKANANGIELTNITPYSTKYTGYPITKGSLTVDVHYLLDQQKLTAENHIFIDQLTFGDRVQNSTATNLPIRLAVSLLKDARGQIDVRVPVSGSLNDPHFSIGGVILRAFANLIIKAATAPFSLLASAIGGGKGGSGEDYSRIVFAPGWATVTPENRTRLDSLAKALKDRPALKLNIVGRIDPRFDVSGLREAMLTREVRAQKIKDVGGDDSESSTEVQVSADQYDKYLARAYKAADFSKPRNAIGLTKSLPPDQMKKLMIEHISVTSDDLRKLAVSRADAVQKTLATHVEPSRLAVLAPKLNADDIKDKSQTTRVDLSFQ
jgi:hypothetical protein